MATLTTMYAAQANSPAAVLTAVLAIGSGSATVDDDSILLAAPTKLTLGADKTYSETVLLTAKPGANVLTITRAQDGTTAREWPIGTTVQRCFTAGDHDAFKANIETLNTDKQEEITASGILKGAGGGTVSAATAGTDYLEPVTSPTAGNFAGLDASGVVTDSGSKAADFSRNETITTGGVANAYTVTTGRSLAAYYAGLPIRIKLHAASTAAAITVNVDGLGAKAVKAYGITDVEAVDYFKLNSVHVLAYDGTNFIIQGYSAGGGGETSAVGSYVGTGTVGSSSPNTLAFGFIPSLVIITRNGYGYHIAFLALVHGSTISTGFGQGGAVVGDGDANYYHQIVSWNDGAKSVSWYHDSTDDRKQLNDSGVTYNYIAIK